MIFHGFYVVKVFFFFDLKIIVKSSHRLVADRNLWCVPGSSRKMQLKGKIDISSIGMFTNSEVHTVFLLIKLQHLVLCISEVSQFL